MIRATRRPLAGTPEESKHLQEDLSPDPQSSKAVTPLSPSLPSSSKQSSSESQNIPKKSVLSIDQIYRAERATNKVNHWKNNQYAVGFSEPTWNDELGRMVGRPENDEEDVNGPNRSCCEDAASEQIDPTCGCLILSALVCSKIGAGRIGNMAVLKERNVMVETLCDLNEGQNDSEVTNRRVVNQRKIDIIVGPYWPCLVFVTFPVILGLTLTTAVKAIFIPGQYKLLIAAWSALSIGLCCSLFGVGCRDPGILPKYREIPSKMVTKKSRWRWNDQAQTYKPHDAVFDPDCAVVIEEFDHTCPWTGTAIGKKNMTAFQVFVTLVFICVPLDILLLAGMMTKV